MFGYPQSFFLAAVEQTQENIEQPEATTSKIITKNKNADRKDSRRDSEGTAGQLHQDLVNKLLDDVKKEKDDLRKENEALKKQNEKLWNQSAEVFRRNKPSTLENIYDEFPTVKLVNRLTHLYDDVWFDLCSKDENNHKIISSTSFLMKEVNNRCKLFAENQLRTFLNLSKDDYLPRRNEKPELYRLRRLENMDPKKTEKIAQDFVQEMTHEGYPYADHVSTIGHQNEFFDFFENFVQVCWQLAVADEDILLDFDATNHPYERFNKCSLEIPTDGEENIVVWPCVRKSDGKVLEKGSVNFVNEKKESRV